MIFRLVAIATYLILTYSTANRPIVQYKTISLKFKEERPKFSSQTNEDRTLLSDGIYLFGQSSQPEKIQNEYFVFQLENGKVIGALYLPHSAFYCFYGFYKQNSLDVKVVDSYDNTASDYIVDLEKYYPINQVSENDARILNTCQTNYQNLAW
ncbi:MULTISPECIES: hypothetical protein [Okeania]|uniref:Uncharacterized protein n=1 Tax=Okeania hirsuta TaxID=1458930 RepID=A0A3N6PT95_9CYAN|nr:MULTISPECIES: hypothetical protein [Okeania]NEP07216.1 hypothetical protein [Okeania sp. SIO4D6]NET16003.1 hypothetical protein [Okeania sp. SIO1H6]NEP74928.1 hypothetical protein [Okeania sp. SIO2G5]NEP96436.1 hypothetical protein [Okeania sp. SIO2F5]NEQ91802.1 hypothetical protein [Okeania sp. SIO2G4]